jgi:signal transduction histidine kinase
VATIQAEVQSLTNLVSDVGTAATVERADFAIEAFPVPLRSLLADATAFAKTLPGDHPVQAPASVGKLVWADPDRIGQVLRNLLSNAAKYSPEGTPISLGVRYAEEHVRIEVSDRGYGIHPQDLARIFEKFGRGRDESGRRVPGVGLGLYLSRRIVRAHGSELMVTSTIGKGTTFGFDLEVVV